MSKDHLRRVRGKPPVSRNPTPDAEPLDLGEIDTRIIVPMRIGTPITMVDDVGKVVAKVYLRTLESTRDTVTVTFESMQQFYNAPDPSDPVLPEITAQRGGLPYVQHDSQCEKITKNYILCACKFRARNRVNPDTEGAPCRHMVTKMDGTCAECGVLMV